MKRRSSRYLHKKLLETVDAFENDFIIGQWNLSSSNDQQKILFGHSFELTHEQKRMPSKEDRTGGRVHDHRFTAKFDIRTELLAEFNESSSLSGEKGRLVNLSSFKPSMFHRRFYLDERGWRRDSTGRSQDDLKDVSTPIEKMHSSPVRAVSNE